MQKNKRKTNQLQKSTQSTGLKAVQLKEKNIAPDAVLAHF